MKWLLVTLVAAVLIAFWAGIVVVLKVPKYVAPGPLEVAKGLVGHWSLIVGNLEETALEAITGFAAGTVIAVALGLVFLYFKPLRNGLFPFAIGVSTVPLVAVAPILILIFGQGFLSKAVMTAMISFFPTLVNVGKGLESVDNNLLDLLHVLNASRRQLLMKVRIHAAQPYFFSALRITSTACVIGAIIAEWVGSERGLGFLIIQETFNFDAVLLWGVIIVSAALATAFYLFIVLLEKLASRYRVT
ncbi:MAG: ABC transporter permease [Actinobacteria bacterium]|jgi:NitT/TauT family transport system permease protein|nr:ABC transporter permease [Actinomycetota bacterium]